MWFWTFASLGLAGVLDLAVGALLVHLLSEYFAYPLSWWQYAIGAILGASPDIDLFYAFFRKKASGHHEYLTHRPIFGVPFAAAVGWLLGGEFWALAAGIGAFWHYLHDTEGFLWLTGGGIAWCWPFSKKYWGVRNFSVIAASPNHPDESENNLGWFNDCYLKPTSRSLIELSLTGIFGGYVLGALFEQYVGILGAVLFWIAIFGLWMVYANCRTQTHR